MVAGGNFVHLHGHSPWSLLDGAARLEEIIPKPSSGHACTCNDHEPCMTAQAYRLCKVSVKLGKLLQIHSG